MSFRVLLISSNSCRISENGSSVGVPLHEETSDTDIFPPRSWIHDNGEIRLRYLYMEADESCFRASSHLLDENRLYRQAIQMFFNVIRLSGTIQSVDKYVSRGLRDCFEGTASPIGGIT